MKGKLLPFCLGFALGIAAAVFAPRLLGPLVPAGLRSAPESVEGTVVRRQRDQERLLLTINTSQGAALATFTAKVAEIDLLVEEGDAVTLGLGAYQPFVDDPPILAVRKDGPAGETVVPAAQELPPPALEPASPETTAAGEDSPAEAPPGEAPAAEAPPAEAELEEWPVDGDDG